MKDTPEPFGCCYLCLGEKVICLGTWRGSVTVWVMSIEAQKGTVRPRKTPLEGQCQILQALGTRVGLGSLLISNMFWSPALPDSVQSHPVTANMVNASWDICQGG